jgi:phospholipase A1
MQQMLADSSDSTTLGKIRDTCRSKVQSLQERSEHALRARLALEKATELNPFVITPHHRNYFMPLSYWSNPEAHDGRSGGDKYHHLESKFQISLKVPIADLWDDAQLYGAFTGTFFWQCYSSNISRPFRETNYMPELFIGQPLNADIGPIESKLITYGAVHQSNGRDVPLSRSWNRLFFNYIFTTESYYWSLMPWWRIPENKKSNPASRHGDDNPDIEHYMGHFELRVSRVFGNQVADILLRNNFHRDHNAGAAQINYTFPLTHRFKGIIQVFTGYGDSLINYNDYENRVSLGILLTDTL